MLAQPFGLIKEIRSDEPCSRAGLETLGVDRSIRPVLQTYDTLVLDIQGVDAQRPGWAQGAAFIDTTSVAA
jgi:hypothetical protein